MANSESDIENCSIVSSPSDKGKTNEEEHIEEDVQTATGSYLDPGDIRAYFKVDEGSLAEELISNNYKHALNYNGYEVQKEAKLLLGHQKNKELPEPLNHEEIMAVLVYTSIATGNNFTHYWHVLLKYVILFLINKFKFEMFLIHISKIF